MGRLLLVCDLDNTLYDWVHYFVSSFYGMVDLATTIMECDREQLLDDLRAVHRHFRDSEHPFALLETETVARWMPNASPEARAEYLDSAFHMFNSTRKETLRLYPGVKETLSALLSAGIKIVGHTEAKYLSVLDRVDRLKLATYFDAIYCRERSASSRPQSLGPTKQTMGPERPRLIELSHHQSKPSAEVLTEICSREGFAPEETAYVGDSLVKDVMMANHAGALSIWAKYGMTTDHESYAKLVRVSHWRTDDIERELAIRRGADDVKPDYTLEHGFFELCPILLRGTLLGNNLA